MRPLDAAAMAAARSRRAPGERLGELAIWLAGVTGADPPRVHTRIVVAGDEDDQAVEPELSVAELAAAVDRGRDLAAGAAADGVTVLAGRAAGAASAGAATRLAALLTARDTAHAPLGALRRAGDRPIAVVCGLALGAGEHGLGFVCDGLGATAAAAVAVAVEPELRPRLAMAGRSPEPAHAALLEHLGLDPVLDRGDGATAALAVLRVAAAR